MNRLIQKLAVMADVPPERAADQLDRLIHEIVTALRNGEAVELPGVGEFQPGPVLDFKFQTEVSNAAADRVIRNLRRRS